MYMYEILSHTFNIFLLARSPNYQFETLPKQYKKCIFSAIIIHKSFVGLSIAIKINSMKKKKKIAKNICLYIKLKEP